MFAAWCWNTVWMASGRPELLAFRRDVRQVATTQQRVLAKILTDNRDTDFGRRHGFAGLRSPLDFQRRVPPATYDEFRPLVDRIAAGEADVLTAEPVTGLHPTGGTAGGEKLIPYTRSLRRQFQRALRTWIADLFASCPAARRGRAYWSLSPSLGPRRFTVGGVAIGFDDDAEYLGAVARHAARRLLVVPDSLAKVDDLERFRFLTLRHLAAAADLALISVWSPTFFSGLLRDLNRWREALADELEPGRASLLRAGPIDAAALARLWPELALVSCWADGPSAGPFAELRAMLPHATFQPKGLLATEGFTSIPLWNRPAPALAIRSHFFEFIEEAADPTTTRPKLAHELDVGGRYEVVLTTAGGLYRYRTGDGVEVVDRLDECPLVRFIGRFDGTSDLVGEKVSSTQAAAVLEALWRRFEARPAFALLAPGDDHKPPRYRLYLQDRGVTVHRLPEVAAALEQGLAANPYYKQAVGLGQLAAVEVAWLDPEGPAAWDLFCRQHVEAGRRWGDVKLVALDRSPHWEATFAPLVRARSSADDTRA
jgi:hypothetical protein